MSNIKKWQERMDEYTGPFLGRYIYMEEEVSELRAALAAAEAKIKAMYEQDKNFVRVPRIATLKMVQEFSRCANELDGRYVWNQMIDAYELETKNRATILQHLPLEQNHE